MSTAVSSGGDDVLLTARIRDRLGLIGIPYEVARKARDKYLFREFCHEHGLPAPGHALIPEDADPLESVRKLTFPMVVKPVYGASSAYVVRVNNAQELRETVDYLRHNISTDVESALSVSSAIMAEEYIGRMVRVEGGEFRDEAGSPLRSQA